MSSMRSISREGMRASFGNGRLAAGPLAVDQDVASCRAEAAGRVAIVDEEAGKLPHHVVGGDGIELREVGRIEPADAFSGGGWCRKSFLT